LVLLMLVLIAFFALLGVAWLLLWKYGLLEPRSKARGPSGRRTRFTGIGGRDWVPDVRDAEDASLPGVEGVEGLEVGTDVLDGPGEGDGGSGEKRVYGYRPRPAVLSDGERAFLPALRAALPLLTKIAGASEPPMLLAHVRLADVVTPEPFSRGGLAVVSQKHVDFLLCEPVTTRPLLVIELDGASHGSERQRDRDAAKDAACRSAGVPMLRVAVAGAYKPEALAQAMAERLGKVAAGSAGRRA